MVDTITNTNPEVPVTTPTPTPTPVVAQAPEPVQTPPTPAVVEAPPVVETPPSEPVKPAETSLIGDALDATPPESAPKEPKSSDTGGQSEETAPPPSEAKAPEEVAPLPEPVFEPFTLPEDITVDAEKQKEFTALLADLEKTGKADHAALQEFGQKAVDFHVNETKRLLGDYQKSLETYWDKQKTDWKNSAMNDPEIGGNRFNTTLQNALSFIRTHGGTPEQQAEFKSLMNSSGLGNHPAMIRLLANAGLKMSEGKPLAAPQPVSSPKSKISTMYGSKSNYIEK